MYIFPVWSLWMRLLMMSMGYTGSQEITPDIPPNASICNTHIRSPSGVLLSSSFPRSIPHVHSSEFLCDGARQAASLGG